MYFTKIRILLYDLANKIMIQMSLIILASPHRYLKCVLGIFTNIRIDTYIPIMRLFIGSIFALTMASRKPESVDFRTNDSPVCYYSNTCFNFKLCKKRAWILYENLIFLGGNYAEEWDCWWACLLGMSFKFVWRVWNERSSKIVWSKWGPDTTMFFFFFKFI